MLQVRLLLHTCDLACILPTLRTNECGVRSSEATWCIAFFKNIECLQQQRLFCAGTQDPRTPRSSQFRASACYRHSAVRAFTCKRVVALVRQSSTVACEFVHLSILQSVVEMGVPCRSA
eukprot:2905589-Pleurochrysis_carterae.AAC.2